MSTLQSHQKVFGIGLSRTGTTSLGEALNLLGIRTIHFPSDPETLKELKNGSYKLSVLENFQGAVDISVAPYYAQLDKVYPESKFILTVRPMDSWIDSVRSHWSLAERWTGQNYPFIEFIRTAVYGSVEFNENRFRFVYQTHFRNVSNYFSNRSTDLLIMDIFNGDGWQKLCPFLGLPVPNVSFPYLNTSAGNQDWAQRLDSAVDELQKEIAPEDGFVVVGNGKLGIQIPGILPLENRNGLDWGAALNDGAAIEEVEQLRHKRIRFLIFLFPFFWWLDYYPGLKTYLENHSRCVKKTDQLMVLELLNL
jgi:Sulfotransferase domain